MAQSRAVIFGFSGLALTQEEKKFFREVNPYGFILFARNCDNPEQVKALTAELRSTIGRSEVPILIDQEGGRVIRLKPPHWRQPPAAGIFEAMAQNNLQVAKEAVYLNARLIAYELQALGITVNCAPMADIRAEESHDIIGDRAFGTTPQQVSVLAHEMARGLVEGGVLPVLKHIPGHGRARVDSHEALPVVDTPLDILRETDFIPFRQLNQLPFGMTAHIVYTALDKTLSATLSPTVIRYMREEIGFDGVLMSDDISMKALKGDLRDLSKQALAAGCDVILHCNGKMEEMVKVAEAVSEFSPASLARVKHAHAMWQEPKPLSWDQANRQLDDLLTATIAA